MEVSQRLIPMEAEPMATELVNSTSQMLTLRAKISHILKLVHFVLICFFLAFEKILLKIKFMFPSVKQRIIAHINQQTGMYLGSVPVEGWQDTIHNYESWKMDCRMHYLDLYKTVFQGEPVHNSDLNKLDGTPCKVLDLEREGRPLVLNFGSCS